MGPSFVATSADINENTEMLSTVVPQLRCSGKSGRGPTAENDFFKRVLTIEVGIAG